MVPPLTALTPELKMQIEDFMYHEARLLDSRQFREWLALFTEDAHYWVPIRESLEGLPQGVQSEEVIAVSHVDDDKSALGQRVERLYTGLAHAETPASRTRHLVTNVEVAPADGGELLVRSNFLLYQGRRDRSEFMFSGCREDRLRPVDGSWRIARRKVLLDHTVLPRAISVFF